MRALLLKAQFQFWVWRTARAVCDHIVRAKSARAQVESIVRQMRQPRLIIHRLSRAGVVLESSIFAPRRTPVNSE